MQNVGVCCDVNACIHNMGDNQCALSQIKVTEHTENTVQKVEHPHYCQSFCQRG